MRELLLSDQAGFVVVAAPAADPLAQAVALSERLRTEGFPLAGLVLNRVHPLPPGGLPTTDALAAALAGAGAADPGGLAGRAAATVAEEQTLGLRDLDAREGLRRAVGGATLTEVPAMVREPVQLAGIAEVAAALGP